MVFDTFDNCEKFFNNLGLKIEDCHVSLPDRMSEEMIKSFFEGYYDGCGSCYSLELREVEFGKPIVGWDLD